MSEFLEVARQGRVARIALNRPEKRNALTLAFCRDFEEGVRAFREKRAPEWPSLVR